MYENVCDLKLVSNIGSQCYWRGWSTVR